MLFDLYDSGMTAPTQEQDASNDTKIPLFRARSRAKELVAELAELKGRVDHLGMLSTIELEERTSRLQSEADNLSAELERQRADAAAEIEKAITKARKSVEKVIEDLSVQEKGLETRVAELQQQVVVTEDIAILQEVGLYEYRHPLSDAVAYQSRLKILKDRIKVMAMKDGGAVLAATDWTVNGSAPKGRAMVRDYSKLVLRAYNAEADNLVRALKPYKLDSSVDRLTKIAVTISRLGKTMDIRISDAYHQIRVEELALTADYLQKHAEEKEREQAEREHLREERKVQEELARERARLEKEHQHYVNALDRLLSKGDDHDGVARLREMLDQITKKIEDVDYRVANVRAGYVYVISNVGSFGEGMIKIGLTRRLDPTERVRELGDASVPFRYDTHALVFSDDAVGLEAKIHAKLASHRVNWVNKRREFFYITPAEAKEALLDLAGELVEYVEVPEALEYRQSLNEARFARESEGEQPDETKSVSGDVVGEQDGIAGEPEVV